MYVSPPAGVLLPPIPRLLLTCVWLLLPRTRVRRRPTARRIQHRKARRQQRLERLEREGRRGERDDKASTDAHKAGVGSPRVRKAGTEGAKRRNGSKGGTGAKDKVMNDRQGETGSGRMTTALFLRRRPPTIGEGG
ncbi:hypothetical protein C8R46DRAFT_1136465 [Mycena filopes]|nr:hypothetical protein C8R46DRAFT_1136465 [Mycena filopes]